MPNLLRSIRSYKFLAPTMLAIALASVWFLREPIGPNPPAITTRLPKPITPLIEPDSNPSLATSPSVSPSVNIRNKPSASRPLAVLNWPELDVEDKAWMYVQAARFADLIYHLPGLESEDMAKNLEENYWSFRRAIPAPYQAVFWDADPFTGLKLGLFKPQPNAANKNLWVLAIAGTEGLYDAIFDANSGKLQYRQFLGLLTSKFEPIWQGLPEGEKVQLLVTGHSLGGGLAQPVALDLIIQLRKLNHLQSVNLVTWNAFGAFNLIEKFAPQKDELKNSNLTEQGLKTYFALGFGQARHFSVCGDKVSTVGILWPPNSQARLRPIHRFDPAKRECFYEKEEVLEAHLMKTINMIVLNNPKVLYETSPTNIEPDIIERLGNRIWKAAVSNAMCRGAELTVPSPDTIFRRMTNILSQVTDCQQNQSIRREYFAHLNEMGKNLAERLKQDIFQDSPRPNLAEQLETHLSNLSNKKRCF